ncbi:hypothetical protein Q8A73_015720 [Channa argus]|nr:hypothetical protein Q8A73_015720 [Channa argus]
MGHKSLSQPLRRSQTAQRTNTLCNSGLSFELVHYRLAWLPGCLPVMLLTFFSTGDPGSVRHGPSSTASQISPHAPSSQQQQQQPWQRRQLPREKRTPCGLNGRCDDRDGRTQDIGKGGPRYTSRITRRARYGLQAG